MHLFQTPLILAVAASSLDVGTVILIVLAAAMLHALHRLCGIMGEINRTLSKPANPAAPVSAPVESQSATQAQAKAHGAATPDGQIQPEIIAAIAAAIDTVMGKSHRIVSIKPMSSSWERAGRQSVLTSHRIR